MKPRRYQCTMPSLDMREHRPFLVLFQKAILFSLEQRGLLTQAQMERCMEAVERG